MSDFSGYYKYLSKRSFIALIYRWYLLYPMYNKRLVGKVLDYGCGIGDFVRFRDNTVGIDVNPHNVEHCKNYNKEAYTIEIDGDLPFEDESFDSVLIDNVLEHVLEPKRIMEELVRVCKKGGTIMIGVPTEKGFSHDPDHKVFYQEKELIELCTKYNLEKSEFFYSPFKSAFFDKHLFITALHGVFIKK